MKPLTTPGRTLLVLAAALAACSGSSKDSPTIPSSIAVTLSASSASVVQGASTPVTVTLTRTNFTGDVQLSAEGLPSGLTASFSPATLSGGSISSVITLAASTSTSPAGSAITVRARGTGVNDATSAVALTVTAAPTFTLTLTNPTTSIAQGSSGTVNIALARTNFTGAVTLGASGLPSGATAAFAPTSTTTDASVLTITPGAAAAGTYSVTISGAASGMTDRTATLTLTITPPAPAYTLTVPATKSVAQGASGTVDVTLARTNFTGSVTLAVTGLPTGATASFSSNPVPDGTATSTLTIGTGTAAAGTYSLTLTGTATGLTNRTAPLTLTITGGTGTNVVFQFCGSRLPVWVGYQNGTTGGWTRVSVGTGNSYSLGLTAAVGGVAYVQPSSSNAVTSGYETTVVYGTAAELSGYGAASCPGSKTVNGSVAGISSSELADIDLGSSHSYVAGAALSHDFTLQNVPDGAHDLVSGLGPVDFYYVDTKAIIRRAQNPATGSTLPGLDFASTEAFALNTATITVSGVAPRKADVDVSFVTQNGTSTYMSYMQTSSEVAQYSGVPTSRQITGDIHSILADDPGGSVGVVAHYRSVADRTIALGAALSTPTVTTLATSPYARLRMQLAGQSDYNGIVFAGFAQSGATSATTDRYVSVILTAGYLGGAPATWTLDVPDLSAASGFDATWELGSGRATKYYALAYGANAFVVPTDGTVFRYASFTSASTITPTRVSAVSRGVRASTSAFSPRADRRRGEVGPSPDARYLAQVRQRVLRRR